LDVDLAHRRREQARRQNPTDSDLKPKLAGIGGMLLGIAHVIAQGVDWRLAVVSGLMTSVAGMAGVSKPQLPPPAAS
jgi:hypothetical protein